MKPEEVVRHLEAIKKRAESGSWNEIIDKVLKDEKVITRERAIALLNAKPTPEDVKREKRGARIFGVLFAIWIGVGIASYFGFLNVGKFLFWGVFMVLGGVFLSYLIDWRRAEHYSKLSDEEYLREVLEEEKHLRLSGKRDDDDLPRDITDITEPGHPLYDDIVGSWKS